MEKKIKVLALFGKSGAGKDTIQRWLVKNTNMHGIISYTTRPPRENEIDGVNYHFISEKEFEKRYRDCDFLETSQFNIWYYGTSINSLDKNKINVGVFNVQGINLLLNNDKIEILPVYIYCNSKRRLLRSLNREDIVNCYEVCRRYFADEEDFYRIPFEYVMYDNRFDKEPCGLLNIPEVKEFIKDVG